ncbi:MAG: hypothetical protein ACQR33_01940 [Candidatus Saccharibacteria bacterium]
MRYANGRELDVDDAAGRHIFPDSIRKHPKTTVAIGLAAVCGGLELAGYLTNDTTVMPKGACTSAFAVTQAFRDPGGSQWKTDAGLGEGIIVKTVIPKGSEGVIVGYKSPNADSWASSPMIPATGQVAVKLAIGQGEVVFGVQVVSQNQADCNQVPVIETKTYDATDYIFDAHARLPWVNGLNDVTNLIPNFIP